ncbi:DUF4247 domain-containing protein [Ectobacillus sp. sgz5001026]|uniref:DUF4247 domain-containing protein n=1 Tax=Ectobacillus sp. sgz5001026 TaxID=3242473 RepID=UPI0036D3CAE3
MLKRFVTSMKAAIAVVLVSSLLFGCTNQQSVSSLYPLDSAVNNGSQQSYVYRAENKTVPEVASQLSEQKKPEQISKTDDNQMFLVYSDELYNIQKDKDKPTDTLIEVSNQEFVRNNYNPSFLEGYLLASVLDRVFFQKGTNYGDYRGYSNRNTYKPNIDYHKPTVEEKKTLPPLTKQGVGSIIKRSDSGGSGTSVGSQGTITDKSTPSTNQNQGNVIKSDTPSSNVNPKQSTITPPKSNSPPKTKVGSKGTIIKRK